MPVLETAVKEEIETKVSERVLCINQAFRGKSSGKIVFGRGKKEAPGTLIYGGEGYGICQICKRDSINGKCKRYNPVVVRYFRVS